MIKFKKFLKSTVCINILILCFVFNIILGQSVKVQAVEKKSSENNTIRIRVEGVNSTLADKQVSSGDNALQLLQTAVGSKNVTGSVGQYGYYIDTIDGEGAPDYNSGWYYYARKGMDILAGPVSADQFTDIKNGDGSYKYDEIVFFMSYYLDPQTSSKIPLLSINSNGEDNQLTVKDCFSNSPLQDVQVNIENIGSFKSDKDGIINFKAAKGTYNITVGNRKDGYIDIVPQDYSVFLPFAGKPEDPTNPGNNGSINSTDVKDQIALLRDYYKNVNQLTYESALFMYDTSDNAKQDMPAIASKYVLRQEPEGAAYAANVLALTAAGKNPKNYNGVNYVKRIAESQGADGKFVIAKKDAAYPTTQAWCILALDVAGAKYDAQKAVNALVSMSKDGHYTDVDTTAMVITALSRHKDINGVNGLIKSSLQYIKNNQTETGGFYAFGSDNPYTTAKVIQALVANNIDVTSKEWTKNGKTPLDGLFMYKDGNHFKYQVGNYKDESIVTEQAAIALADVYRGKSIYQTLKLTAVDEAPELPKTGSAIDFSLLITAALICISSGVYILRKKSTNM